MKIPNIYSYSNKRIFEVIGQEIEYFFVEIIQFYDLLDLAEFYK